MSRIDDSGRPEAMKRFYDAVIRREAFDVHGKIARTGARFLDWPVVYGCYLAHTLSKYHPHIFDLVVEVIVAALLCVAGVQFRASAGLARSLAKLCKESADRWSSALRHETVYMDGAVHPSLSMQAIDRVRRAEPPLPDPPRYLRHIIAWRFRRCKVMYRGEPLRAIVNDDL